MDCPNMNVRNYTNNYLIIITPINNMKSLHLNPFDVTIYQHLITLLVLIVDTPISYTDESFIKTST